MSTHNPLFTLPFLFLQMSLVFSSDSWPRREHEDWSWYNGLFDALEKAGNFAEESKETEAFLQKVRGRAIAEDRLVDVFSVQ